METIHEILVHIGVCDGNLEQGQFRCDANVSLRPVGTSTFGTRSEIKNLNSFRSVERAINAEIKRQTEILTQGGVIIQETRNYDDTTQTTTSLRSKEDAHDYRYFPEPDLPPLIISDALLEALKKALPEHPRNKRQRYQSQLKLSKEIVTVLMGDIDMDNYFNDALDHKPEALSPQRIAQWIVGDLNALLKNKKQLFSKSPITPERLIELLSLINSNDISGKMAKELLPKLLTTTGAVKDLVTSEGGSQISDESALLTVVNQVLGDNGDVVEKIKKGKTQAAGFLMGQVMKVTQGKANPDIVRSLILSEVEKR
jgi:aspartyl-tRNA(Asn)/glutamyl-tRNA(Gln) amidotransferase subunit B